MNINKSKSRDLPKSGVEERNMVLADSVAGVQSIHRAADLLRAITSRGSKGTRLVDLTRQCQLERPTAHRILKGLVAEGMVTQDPATRRYFLGPLLYEMGLASMPEYKFQQVCEPILLKLAEYSGDTVFLLQRSGLDAVCIDRREGSFPIKTLTLDIGGRRPLGVGAGGLALLMPLSDTEVKEILETLAWRIAKYVNLRTTSVFDLLKRSKDRGYAMNDIQVTAGAISIGLPIRNPNGPPHIAISIGAISERMTPDRLETLSARLRTEILALEKVLYGGPGTNVRKVPVGDKGWLNHTGFDGT